MIQVSSMTELRENFATTFPKIIRTRLALIGLGVALSVIIFSIWRIKFARSKIAYSVPTPENSNAVDWTDPKTYENAAPVDLTTAGATAEIPDDHPLRKMNGFRPAELAPFHNSKMTSETVASHLSDFDNRLKILEQKNE